LGNQNAHPRSSQSPICILHFAICNLPPITSPYVPSGSPSRYCP
jgi:hypothetical protein